jgi:hypothetical protein
VPVIAGVLVRPGLVDTGWVVAFVQNVPPIDAAQKAKAHAAQLVIRDHQVL